MVRPVSLNERVEIGLAIERVNLPPHTGRVIRIVVSSTSSFRIVSVATVLNNPRVLILSLVLVRECLPDSRWVDRRRCNDNQLESLVVNRD